MTCQIVPFELQIKKIYWFILPYHLDNWFWNDYMFLDLDRNCFGKVLKHIMAIIVYRKSILQMTFKIGIFEPLLNTIIYAK